ncbi:hypothetical protein R6Q59_010939 [Mikania micrantha]
MRNQWVILVSHLILSSTILITSIHTCPGAENMSFCNEQERLVLLKFKQSVYDEFGMLSSWAGKDCCQWKGVGCDAATGSVVSLCLAGQNIWNSYYFPESNPADVDSSDNDEDYYHFGKDCYLVGDQLSTSLAELRNLRYLDLSGNDFRKSRIPEFIGSLKHLSYLNLSNAGFSGTIPPHIGNLSELEVLDLSAQNQDLMADDVAWAFSLSFLKHLDLSGVDLLGVQSIDMVLYMIPSLVKLSLRHCSVTNAHFGSHLNLSRTLPNIQYLDLSKNFLNDQLPPFLQNMTSLEFLDISNSDFSLQLNLESFLNMIPSLLELHLSDCELNHENLSPSNLNSSIKNLDLSRNSIEGSFPYVLTNISSLRVLNLRHNFLNSSIPIMPSLENLDISGNNFKDLEHVGIWRQCQLRHLSLSGNNLGEKMIDMPTNISECSQYRLEVLYLDHNELNGSILESLITMTNLRFFGKIPISIGQLSNLNFLNVSSNHLEGTVYESHFANLTKLAYLDMSFNSNLTLDVSHDWIPPFNLTALLLSNLKITHEFPRWVGTQINLKKLVLSNTSISGPLPTWFEQMPIIPHLDLSYNNLTGPLTNLPLGDHFNGLQDEYRGSLLLQNNLFNGSIPMSLCRRISLEILDLSSNRLTGKIPTCLQNLKKLRAMILSYNGLSGVIPSSIGGNSLLSWLHLNDNNFTGELPQDLANLHHLWILDLGSNELSGNIPEWISELTELMVLRLYKNKITGRIPVSLCKNACLQIFDVAHNNLKGPIPSCVGYKRFYT